MSAEVALIGFPRLHEREATRLLAEHNLRTERVSPDEAAARLSIFSLALFFWPDGGELAVQRLKAMRSSSPDKPCPILIVTSQTGHYSAQKSVGEDADDIMLTPLQSHDVSQKLAKYVGLVDTKESISVDADFINPFVTATLDKMKQMAGTTCERTGLRLSSNATARGYYSGTVDFAGNVDGFVSMTFSKELATKIVSRMRSVTDTEISEEDVRTGVGDFVNVVAEAAKAELADSVSLFSLTPPQVFSGGPHTAAQPLGIPVFMIEFSADGDLFDVLVCLRQKKS